MDARVRTVNAEVAEALPKTLNLAYNTVLTTLRILEEKGYLQHTKREDAKAFRYAPVVEQGAGKPKGAAHSAMDRFFWEFAWSANSQSP